jgi:2-amino-4-hydroxy-6-hydroxymethyldihydropteridine diphosphokinase
MTTVVRAYIGLGSNLEAPIEQVRSAIAALGRLPALRLVHCSSLYRTKPVGFADQPDFINAVCAIDTSLPPPALLDHLMTIEQAQGRARDRERNTPRTLDLDLLVYGEVELSSPDLTIPHPRLHERAFVLVPLAEIAPTLQVPRRGDIGALLARCNLSGVWRLEERATPLHVS